MKTHELSLSELSVFCAQATIIIKSGIKLDDGFNAFSKDMPRGRVRNAITETSKNLGEHMSLFEAMRKTGFFPQYTLRMAELGESAGNLDVVFDRLSSHYEREQEVRAQIKETLLYPLVLFMLMAVVIGVLVVRVLPALDNIFKQLGGEMSAGAAAVMSFGLSAGKYALWAIVAVAVLIVLLYGFYKTKEGNAFFGRLFAKFALTRRIASKMAARRFAEQMSLMLENGLPMDEALTISAGASENEFVKAAILKCKKDVANGVSLAEAAQNTQIFPQLFISMLSLGTTTGNTDNVLSNISTTYENELDDALNTASSIAEPALVGLLTVTIGAILISVMLPLIGIMSAMG